MSENALDYGILVAVDGSAESNAAIRWASREAILRRAPITLIHIISPVVISWPVGQYLGSSAFLGSVGEWQDDNARQVIEQALKTVKSSVGESDAPPVQTEIVTAEVVSALSDASKQAQLTVVGSRGLGALSRVVLGSVSAGVVQHGHGPVAVVHSDDAGTPDAGLPVLLGIDGSAVSEDATALAFDEAARRGVDLVALHAWADVGKFAALGVDWAPYEEEGHEVLGERLAGWQERYPDVHVHRRLVSDRPSHWLIEASKEAQLVVLGSHGRGGFAGMLLGSVSRAVAQAAHAPVIVVRPRPN